MTFEKAIKKAMTEQASKKEWFILEELKPFFDYDEKTNTATIKEFVRLRLQSIDGYKQKVLEVLEEYMKSPAVVFDDEGFKKELGLE